MCSGAAQRAPIVSIRIIVPLGGNLSAGADERQLSAAAASHLPSCRAVDHSRGLTDIQVRTRFARTTRRRISPRYGVRNDRDRACHGSRTRRSGGRTSLLITTGTAPWPTLRTTISWLAWRVKAACLVTIRGRRSPHRSRDTRSVDEKEPAGEDEKLDQIARSDSWRWPNVRRSGRPRRRAQEPAATEAEGSLRSARAQHRSPKPA